MSVSVRPWSFLLKPDAHSRGISVIEGVIDKFTDNSNLQITRSHDRSIGNSRAAPLGMDHFKFASATPLLVPVALLAAAAAFATFVYCTASYQRALATERNAWWMRGPFGRVFLALGAPTSASSTVYFSRVTHHPFSSCAATHRSLLVVIAASIPRAARCAHGFRGATKVQGACRRAFASVHRGAGTELVRRRDGDRGRPQRQHLVFRKLNVYLLDSAGA